MCLPTTADAATQPKRCRQTDGALLFTDLPRPPGSVPLEAHAAAAGTTNFVTGARPSADPSQPERQREYGRRPPGPALFGLPDPDQARRCSAARERLEAHRERARRPHALPLLERGRALQALVRADCN